MVPFNGIEGEEDFEDLGVIEGEESNHDEGHRTIMSLTNKLGGMNMRPSLRNNGENYVLIDPIHVDGEDEIMRKILEESIKTAEEEEKKRKQKEDQSKKEEVKGEAKDDKNIYPQL